jgi:hypothetical protein
VAGRSEFPLDGQPQHLDVSGPLVGGAPGRALVEDHPQGVHVGRRPDVVVPGLGLLGGHVLRGAQDLPGAGLRRPAPLQQLGQPEIDHPGDVVLAAQLARAGRRLLLVGVVLGRLEDDIGRLQVAVQHPAVVGVLNRVGHRRHQPGRLPHRHRERLVLQPFTQRLSGTERGGDEAHRADLAGLVDRDQVGVVELGGGQGLADQPPPGVRAHQHLGPRDLQGNLALQLRVVGQEHDPTPALAQLPAQLEPPDPVDAHGRHQRGQGRLPLGGGRHRVRQHLAQRNLMGRPTAQWGDPALAGRRRGGRHQPLRADRRGLPVPAVDALLIRRQQPGQVFVELKRVGRFIQLPLDVSRVSRAGSRPQV